MGGLHSPGGSELSHIYSLPAGISDEYLPVKVRFMLPPQASIYSYSVYSPTAPMSTEKDLEKVPVVVTTELPCRDETATTSSRTSLDNTPQEDAFIPPDGGLEAWSQALAGCLVNMLAWGYVPSSSPSFPPPTSHH